MIGISFMLPLNNTIKRLSDTKQWCELVIKQENACPVHMYVWIRVSSSRTQRHSTIKAVDTAIHCCIYMYVYVCIYVCKYICTNSGCTILYKTGIFYSKRIKFFLDKKVFLLFLVLYSVFPSVQLTFKISKYIYTYE